MRINSEIFLQVANERSGCFDTDQMSSRWPADAAIVAHGEIAAVNTRKRSISLANRRVKGGASTYAPEASSVVIRRFFASVMDLRLL